MHKQHPQTAYRKYAVLIGTIFENCDNFGIAERLRTLRYPIFTGKGRDGKRQLRRLFPAEMRRCEGELPKPRFPRGVAADRGSRPWGIIRFLRKKSAKTFESPFYSILIVRYCVHRGSPGNKTDTQEGNTMKDFELRYVGSHVEVYTGSGVFLFSADTVREAMEELAG